MTTALQARTWGWRLSAWALVLPLIACGTVSENAHYVTSKPLTEKKEVSFTDAGKASFSAALSPLEDLGLRKRDIPEILSRLAKNPYYPPPKPFRCDDVKQEMAQLDYLLGDEPHAQPQAALSDNEEYVMAGAEMVQDTVVGMVKSQVNIIPFKSIVRRITGANKHEKLVAKAMQGGVLRRAYLRGLSAAEFGDSCLPGPRVMTASAEGETPEEDGPVTLGDRVALVAKDW